jgi:hypothetical protein
MFVHPERFGRYMARYFSNPHKAGLPAFCAPGGIRTPNDGSEDRRDIHFTTGANAKITYKLYIIL